MVDTGGVAGEIAGEALQHELLAAPPLHQAERPGAVLLGRQSGGTDLLGESPRDHLLECQHGRKHRPGLFQHEPHRGVVQLRHRLQRTKQVLARTGLAIDRAGGHQPREGEHHIIRRQNAAAVQPHVLAQGEVIGQRIARLPPAGQLRDHLHLSIMRRQAIVHQTQQGFGVACAVVTGVERYRIDGEADLQVGGARAGSRQREHHDCQNPRPCAHRRLLD